MGGMVDPDYDGFSHLSHETLNTRPDIDGECWGLDLFLPKDDVTGGENVIWVYTAGIQFDIEMHDDHPMFRDCKSPEEKLMRYLKKNYDPFTYTVYPGYRGVEISDIETLEHGARATVKYCMYNAEADRFYPVFDTCYIADLTEDVTVCVRASVGDNVGGNVTSETEEMIRELESFYQFDIEWSLEAAKQKLAEFLESDESKVNMASIYYMMFEIPRGWIEDRSWRGYDIDMFSPGGNYFTAGCAITFQKGGFSKDGVNITEMSFTREEMKEYQDYIREQLGGCGDITVEQYGITAIGPAIKVSTTVEKDGVLWEAAVYQVVNGNDQYTIQAFQAPDCTEDAFFVVDTILATAVLKQYD